MKRKFLIISVLLCSVFLITLGLSAVSKVGNYNDRGVKDIGHLLNGQEALYNRYIFVDLSTIASNDEYGTFVFRKNGEFTYYPKNNNIFYDSNSNVYKYEGIWYYNFKEMRFTVTRTYLSRKILNVLFKDKEFFCSFGYNNSGEMTYNDDLIIEGQPFNLLINELTENSKEKLRLEDSIIDEFLKRSN